MAVAPMAPDNDDPDVESSISRALKLRSSYLRGKADSLTLPAVRRLLERDLGLKPLHLEPYKAFIKNLVDKVLNEVDDEDVIMEKPRKRRKKNSRVIEDGQDGDSETKADDENNQTKGKVSDNAETVHGEPTVLAVESSENCDDPLKNASETQEKSDKQGSPEGITSKTEREAPEKQGDTQEAIVGNLSSAPEHDATEIRAGETAETKDVNCSDVKEEDKSTVKEPQSNLGSVDENAIKLALMRRANELKSQAESLTVVSVRRLLEEDLGLEPNGLDAHKRFIRMLVDELLVNGNDDHDIDSSEVVKAKKEQAPGVAEGRPKKKTKVKSSVDKKRVQNEVHCESEEKLTGDGELSGSESEENRQGKVWKKKTSEVKKVVEVKKNADVKRPFSANVERLREIIKSIGLGVPPAVYRKAKQASEDERDEVLVKELESILAREGLSSHPSPPEIRKVKARLAKMKDLDGIETSNIVAEPRRSRAAANSWFTPRQSKYSERSDNLEAEDSDDDVKPKVTEKMDD